MFQKNINHLTSTLYLNFTLLAFMIVSYSATKIELYAASASKTHKALPCLADTIINESSPCFVMSPSLSFVIRIIES